jgi:hypothetical protein
LDYECRTDHERWKDGEMEPQQEPGRAPTETTPPKAPPTERAPEPRRPQAPTYDPYFGHPFEDEDYRGTRF